MNRVEFDAARTHSATGRLRLPNSASDDRRPALCPRAKLDDAILPHLDRRLRLRLRLRLRANDLVVSRHSDRGDVSRREHLTTELRHKNAARDELRPGGERGARRWFRGAGFRTLRLNPFGSSTAARSQRSHSPTRWSPLGPGAPRTLPHPGTLHRLPNQGISGFADIERSAPGFCSGQRDVMREVFGDGALLLCRGAD
jgi:hypothetical protein